VQTWTQARNLALRSDCEGETPIGVAWSSTKAVWGVDMEIGCAICTTTTLTTTSNNCDNGDSISYELAFAGLFLS